MEDQGVREAPGVTAITAVLAPTPAALATVSTSATVSLARCGAHGAAAVGGTRDEHVDLGAARALAHRLHRRLGDELREVGPVTLLNAPWSEQTKGEESLPASFSVPEGGGDKR